MIGLLRITEFCLRYPDKEYMKQYEGKCVLWDEDFVGRHVSYL